MDDQTRSVVLAQIVGDMTEWAKMGVYCRRIASDRFLILMDKPALEQLEESRFDILDVVVT